MHSPSRSHSSQYVDVNSAQNYAVSTDPLSENNAYEFDKTQPSIDRLIHIEMKLWAGVGRL